MEAQSGCTGEIYVTTAGTPESRPERPVQAVVANIGATGAARKVAERRGRPRRTRCVTHFAPFHPRPTAGGEEKCI